MGRGGGDTVPSAPGSSICLNRRNLLGMGPPGLPAGGKARTVPVLRTRTPCQALGTRLRAFSHGHGAGRAPADFPTGDCSNFKSCLARRSSCQGTQPFDILMSKELKRNLARIISFFFFFFPSLISGNLQSLCALPDDEVGNLA